MSHVVVLIHGQPTLAAVVQENAKTLWVRLKDGQVIKRHREKHLMGDVIKD